QGLVRGIPLTHCVLLVYDRAANAYVVQREESYGEGKPEISTIRADTPIVQWLQLSSEVLVKEEVKLNPRMAAYFETAEGERQETYLRSVHKSGTHLLQLINDILDFSRIEAGRVEVHPEEIDLHELVTECIESSLPLLRGKPLRIDQEVPDALPRLIADRTKVKQIL